MSARAKDPFYNDRYSIDFYFLPIHEISLSSMKSSDSFPRVKFGNPLVIPTNIYVRYTILVQINCKRLKINCYSLLQWMRKKKNINIRF